MQSDNVGSRQGLQGAIAKDSSGPTYYFFPDVVSALGQSSRKLHLSEDGDPATASDKTEAAVNALNIDRVCYGLIKGPAGTVYQPLAVAGDASQSVTLQPVIGTEGGTRYA